MREDEREWNECRACGNTMLLDEGREWPEDGPICYGCLDKERDRLYAELVSKDQAAAKTGLMVLALMEQRDKLLAALGAAERERDRLIGNIDPPGTVYRCPMCERVTDAEPEMRVHCNTCGVPFRTDPNSEIPAAGLGERLTL